MLIDNWIFICLKYTKNKYTQERKVIADEYNNNVSRQLNWHFSGSPREDKKELDNEACSLLWMHNVQNVSK